MSSSLNQNRATDGSVVATEQVSMSSLAKKKKVYVSKERNMGSTCSTSSWAGPVPVHQPFWLGLGFAIKHRGITKAPFGLQGQKK